MFDSESGLHYNRHRYYDPSSSQYISPDPIGLQGGFRSPAYVQNPQSSFDPLGLTSCDKETDVDLDWESPDYDPRVERRALEDPYNHNFPHSFDESILKTVPTTVRGGGLGYALRGIRNGKEVVYNMIVRNGVVVHRDIVPLKEWPRRMKNFGWEVDLEDLL
ncbi:RHS repeat-associated core domain-containing protein [Acanthopleuribacter pedis]|uniref:RHS repeat-associated core domain-containing protein n=1 Tax=Acanthopleuribacter pedis TaxID=442870 RepID=A0A8J7QD77_9BACT|nr:RHS repeat-associated core domain-containing protein [Acanthopleuribacter pedis]MBO1321984.1 RHS repeat-associated core domain-containing protein [Acanthopleuribacter pedis]